MDNGEINKVVNQLSGETGGVPDTARKYKVRVILCVYAIHSCYLLFIMQNNFNILLILCGK